MCDVTKLRLHKRCKTPLEPAIIYIGNEKIGVCQQCWNKIADKDWEWGNTPRPTMEQILSEETRGLVGAIKTEYKYHGVKKEEKRDKDNEDLDFE